MWMSSCSWQNLVDFSFQLCLLSPDFPFAYFFFCLWITYYKEILFSVLKVLEPKHLLWLKKCLQTVKSDGSPQKHFEDPEAKPQTCSGSVSGWDEGSHSNVFFRMPSWESALAARSVKARTMETAVEPGDAPGSFWCEALHTNPDCQGRRQPEGALGSPAALTDELQPSAAVAVLSASRRGQYSPGRGAPAARFLRAQSCADSSVGEHAPSACCSGARPWPSAAFLLHDVPEERKGDLPSAWWLSGRVNWWSPPSRLWRLLDGYCYCYC